MRIRVEYFDQNESFVHLLPIAGTVERTPVSCDSNPRWYLLALDAAVEYNGTRYSHFLIASRWKEHNIEGADPVSVFILLVQSPNEAVDGFSHESFPFVAWGVAHVIDT
jgi:hypothetical protein